MALLKAEEYLAHAKEAFEYVRKAMTKGAGNRLLDQPSGASFMERKQCVEGSVRTKTEPLIKKAWHEELDRKRQDLKKRYGEEWRGVITKQALDEAGAETDTRTWGRAIDINAEYAERFGCGNCEEQSSLTFRFLRDRGVKPLDLVKQEGWVMGFGNHAFVILGRDGKTDIAKISTWNSEVVWCDPYENELGGLDKIKERFDGKELSLLYRWGDS